MQVLLQKKYDIETFLVEALRGNIPTGEYGALSYAAAGINVHEPSRDGASRISFNSDESAYMNIYYDNKLEYAVDVKTLDIELYTLLPFKTIAQFTSYKNSASYGYIEMGKRESLETIMLQFPDESMTGSHLIAVYIQDEVGKMGELIWHHETGIPEHSEPSPYIDKRVPVFVD